MAAIINALFGTYPDPPAADNQTVAAGSSGVTTERLHTSAVADDVQVRSVISSETQANAVATNRLNIDNLLSQLGTTHSQVDAYSRARTAAINDQVQKSIADVLARTQRQQEELLVDANRRHLAIDNEYKLQLQKAVEALDAVKAKTLAVLERELQAQQQVILAEAKREIDVLNDQANAAKLHALVEAQEQASKDIAQITDQVAVLGQLEAQNLLQSTTTTVITSKAEAAGAPEGVVVASTAQTNVTTNEQTTTTTSTTATAGDNGLVVAGQGPVAVASAPAVPTTATDVPSPANNTVF